MKRTVIFKPICSLYNQRLGVYQNISHGRHWAHFMNAYDCNSISYAKLLCCFSVTYHQITSKFCTCHGSSIAAMACAEFSGDHFITTKTRAKYHSMLFEHSACKLHSVMVHWCSMTTHTMPDYLSLHVAATLRHDTHRGRCSQVYHKVIDGGPTTLSKSLDRDM